MKEYHFCIRGVITDLGFGHGEQQYKFGGTELDMANGLNEYDFGARRYHQGVPMFTQPDPMAEKYYWLSPYVYCGNNPVNAVDPTGKVVIVLDSISQRNLTLTLSPDDEQYVKFTDGVLNVALLNESESDYENINALKALANSDTKYYISMSQTYTTKGETKEMKHNSTQGTVGVTLIPGASEEPSPDKDVHIYVSSYLTPFNHVLNTAHEAYGHAYFYELTEQGFDVDPFHRKKGDSCYLEYDTECRTYSPVMVRRETNLKLLKQIDIVTKQAENFI